jgi:hypothetical protein
MQLLQQEKHEAEVRKRAAVAAAADLAEGLAKADEAERANLMRRREAARLEEIKVKEAHAISDGWG